MQNQLKILVENCEKELIRLKVRKQTDNFGDYCLSYFFHLVASLDYAHQYLSSNSNNGDIPAIAKLRLDFEAHLNDLVKMEKDIKADLDLRLEEYEAETWSPSNAALDEQEYFNALFSRDNIQGVFHCVENRINLKYQRIRLQHLDESFLRNLDLTKKTIGDHPASRRPEYLPKEIYWWYN